MDTKNTLPPVKIAILIDGGFFIKRFNSIYNKDRTMSGKEVAAYLYTFAHKHVGAGNVLYRIFYYDCIPFGKRMQNPISKRTIDYSKSEEFKFRTELIEELKLKRKVALRLGELRDNKNWIIHAKKVKELLASYFNRNCVPVLIYPKMLEPACNEKIPTATISIIVTR